MLFMPGSLLKYYTWLLTSISPAGMVGRRLPWYLAVIFLLGSWLSLQILICPFPISVTEDRKGPIYSKSERKGMLWKLLYSACPWPGSPHVLEECASSIPYVSVRLVQILKHTWSSNNSSHSISGKEVGKDSIHEEE